MGRSRMRVMGVLLAVVTALLSTVLNPGPASADLQRPHILRITPVPDSGRVSCYGYYGTFKPGTDVIVVDWVSSSDECFAIAPNLTIWHTWPGSGGWHQMGGNGHADNTYWYSFKEDPAIKARSVAVFVSSSNTVWCQDYLLPKGWQNEWYQCPFS
ncbi:hypothetical protein [Actinocrispum sp. NPDC049592]|uniref:hypothetical protein n=1 Tax=Actinocrispum sp. NPDC049592 TaxID=3154835 RepID=UPI003425867C